MLTTCELARTNVYSIFLAHTCCSELKFKGVISCEVKNTWFQTKISVKWRAWGISCGRPQNDVKNFVRSKTLNLTWNFYLTPEFFFLLLLILLGTGQHHAFLLSCLLDTKSLILMNEGISIVLWGLTDTWSWNFLNVSLLKNFIC